MELWIDSDSRVGPEAMAVDEWLLETTVIPVLRVYRWQGEWGSLGYFGKLAEARASLPGLEWVRRWTGGGMVDHRTDWTYSVVAPQREAISQTRGAWSYRCIHRALNTALGAQGVVTRMSEGDMETGAALCFENPVNYDLLDDAGRKIAGAGQRRSRQGLLHQGSVALGRADEAISRRLAETFSNNLASNWQEMARRPSAVEIARRVTARYARPEWTSRR